jgi:hypothetical protein
MSVSNQLARKTSIHDILRTNYNEIFEYYQKGIYPSTERIIVIGDIHGDYNAFINVLKKSNIINSNLEYIGGKSHVVQVGDILDRKPRELDGSDEDSEAKIISLIMELQIKSYLQGGGYHAVLGNHELMNVMGQFDYVSPMGLMHYGGHAGRRLYFKPGGTIANYFACGWNPIVKIGGWLFCHGGVSKKIAEKYKIEDINYIMRDYLYGNEEHKNKKYFDELFMNSQSILWNRDFSSDHHQSTYQKLNDDLNTVCKNYQVKRLCSGHTPQMKGIKHRFNGRLFNVDTGMSSAFGKKNDEMERLHFMEIWNDSQKIRIY